MITSILLALIKFVAGKIGYELHKRGQLEKAREEGRKEGAAEAIAEFSKQEEKKILEDKHKPSVKDLNDVFGGSNV